MTLSSSWGARLFLFTDRRSLTERQRKYLEMYADDMEGRTTADRTPEGASSSASGSESQQQQQTEKRSKEEKPLGG